MNLRIARKILKAVGTDRCPYNDFQVGKALERVEKTRSAKEDRSYWEWLMTSYRGTRMFVVASDADDLLELTDEDRAAIDGLGDDFIERLLAGERPLAEPTR